METRKLSLNYQSVENRTWWFKAVAWFVVRCLVVVSFVRCRIDRSIVEWRNESGWESRDNRVALIIRAVDSLGLGSPWIACRVRGFCRWFFQHSCHCFAAATVCVWLWRRTLGYSQPGLWLLTMRWMERGNVPLLLFFARSDGTLTDERVCVVHACSAIS